MSRTMLRRSRFDRTRVWVGVGRITVRFVGLGRCGALSFILALSALLPCGRLCVFCLLICGVPLLLSLAIQLGDGLLSILGEAVAGIAAQDFLEGRAGFVGIVEVVFVDLPDGEQGVEAILAAGVLTAQELVLSDGVIQNLVGFEATAHLD